MKKSKNFKNIINTIFLALSIGILIYFCIQDNNLIVLIQNLKNANYFYLICSIICLLINCFLDCALFQILFNKILKIKFSWFECFKLTMIGQFYGAITPFQAGTQPSQVIKLSQKGINSGTAISVIIKKFLVSQTAVVIFSTIFILLKSNIFIKDVPLFFPFVGIGFLFQCFPIALLSLFYINKNFTLKAIELVTFSLQKLRIIKNKDRFQKKITSELNLFVESNKSLKCNIKLNVLLYLIPAIGFISLNLIPFFVYKTLNGSGFPIINLLATQIFITTASAVTPLPGGGGASEGGFLMLFNHFFSANLLTPAMILCRLIGHYLNIIFGILFIFDRKKSEKV